LTGEKFYIIFYGTGEELSDKEKDMRVYPSRNTLATEQFINDVLKYCEGKPTFIVDNAPWLKQSLEELGLPYNAEPFRR
jgi:transposase-like protein